MTNIGYNGLWGLPVLAGDIWAIINIYLAAGHAERVASVAGEPSRASVA